jgi:hypothetical protein
LSKKRKVLVLVSLALALLLMGAAASQSIRLEINGKEVKSDVAPVIVDGRTLVPVRVVSETLGAKVAWDATTRTVKITSSRNDRLSTRGAILEAVTSAMTPRSIVDLWAEGVFTCDASLQWAALSPDLRASSKTAFDSVNWVTGYPGGWADSYEVAEDVSENAIDRRYSVKFKGTVNGVAVTEEMKVTASQKRGVDSSIRWVLSSVAFQGSGTVPVIFRQVKTATSGVRLHDEDWFSAKWDTGAGAIRIDASMVGRISTTGVPVIWDGGTRINLVPDTLGSSVNVEDAQASFVLNKLSAPDDPAKGTAGWVIEEGKRIPAVVYGNDLLRIYSSKIVKKVPLEVIKEATKSVLKPVGIAGTYDDPRVYYEVNISDPAPGRRALFECSVTSRGLVWRDVCDDLVVNESGSGTNMTIVKDRLYIGTQDGKVKYVELSSGKLTEWTEANQMLEVFRRNYANRMTVTTAPSITGYGDVVLVTWVPNVLKTVSDAKGTRDEVSSAIYMLATAGDSVLGEARVIDNNITVLKNGIVTGTALLPGAGETLPLMPME